MNSTFTVVVTTMLAIVITTISKAQTVRQISVNQLFELGIANSLQVKSSQTNLNISQSDLYDKRSNLLPDINIGLMGGYVGEPTIFQQGLSGPTHPSMPDWNQNYNIEVLQPIYQGNKTKYSIEKADLQRQIAELVVQRDVSQIKLLLIEKYLNLFGLYKQENVFNVSIEQAKQRLHDIKVMERNGMVTSSDVLRSELQLSNYLLALSQTQNDIKIISQQLDIALGIDENLILIPDTTVLEVINNIPTCGDYIEMAYNNYPELKIAESYINVVKLDSKIVKSDFMPKLSLRASNILSRPLVTSGQDLYSNNWNLGITVSYSISSIYHNKHKADMAKQRIVLQNIEQERVKQNIRVNVNSFYIRHNEALNRVGTLTISVKQANENYRIVLNKYNNHIAILTDLLDASSLLLDAQLQLTNARTNAIYTYYQLLRSSGNL